MEIEIEEAPVRQAGAFVWRQSPKKGNLNIKVQT
jgi:hypothetical protein